MGLTAVVIDTIVVVDDQARAVCENREPLEFLGDQSTRRPINVSIEKVDHERLRDDVEVRNFRVVAELDPADRERVEALDRRIGAALVVALDDGEVVSSVALKVEGC